MLLFIECLEHLLLILYTKLDDEKLTNCNLFGVTLKILWNSVVRTCSGDSQSYLIINRDL